MLVDKKATKTRLKGRYVKQYIGELTGRIKIYRKSASIIGPAALCALAILIRAFFSCGGGKISFSSLTRRALCTRVCYIPRTGKKRVLELWSARTSRKGRPPAPWPTTSRATIAAATTLPVRRRNVINTGSLSNPLQRRDTLCSRGRAAASIKRCAATTSRARGIT